MTRPAQRRLLIVACLLLVTFLVHARATGFGFCVFDDTHQIINNPTLQWKSAPSYFVKDVWQFPQPQYRNYFRPVFLLWLLINFKLFGLHPAFWHLTSIALHGVVVVMVFRLGLRLLGSELAAGAAALLFAVLPTHVESVVWLSGITEPLSAVFFIGAFLLYLRWRETHTLRSMLFCALLTLFAFFAKETAAALPFLIAIYEWLFPSVPAETLRARANTTVRASIPALGAAIIYAAMRINAMHHVAVINNPPLQVFITWPLLLWKYTAMMLWPVGLSLFYSTTLLKQPSLESFWLPLAFTAGSAILLVFAFTRNKLAAFLACWWLLPLVPALVGLWSFPEGDIMHDRYTYLSSVAFVLLLGWAISRVPRTGAQAFNLPVESVVLLLSIFGAWSALSAQQTLVWKNGLTLFSHAVQVAPTNVRARNLLANQFFKAGDAGRALAIYDATLRLDPNAWETNFATGITLLTTGQLPHAEFFLRRSCALDRTNPLGYLYLADALRAQNRISEAQAILQQGISQVDSQPELLRQKLSTIAN